MNRSHDHQLDRLLENWADKNTASAEDLTTLQQRVVEQLADDEANAVDWPTPSTLLRSKGSRRFVVAGLAAAAVLFIAIGFWRYSPTDSQPQLTGGLGLDGYDLAGSEESFEAYWSKFLKHQGRLLTEYHDVFGRDVAWVVETEQNCEVGLAAADAREVVPSEYVVIHLWLVARNLRDGHTEKIDTISVLAGREELVEIPAAFGGSRLAIWAYPIDEKMISIDLRYRPSSVADVEIDGSNLQQVGQVTNIHSFERDGVEYRLYQSAEVLGDHNFG